MTVWNPVNLQFTSKLSIQKRKRSQLNSSESSEMTSILRKQSVSNQERLEKKPRKTSKGWKPHNIGEAVILLTVSKVNASFIKQNPNDIITSIPLKATHMCYDAEMNWQRMWGNNISFANKEVCPST